jgi:hypothetical protein
MAKPRPKIPDAIKSKILAECGDKCANPGCFARRVEFHHIRDWAIWQSHDERHLVALCPTCHDAAHHGRIKLDDTMLYHWKTLKRGKPRHTVFQVEPGPTPIFYIADSAVQTLGGQTNVVDLSETAKVMFRIDSDDFFLVDLRLSNVRGEPIIKMVENRTVHSLSSDVSCESRPGRLVITTDSVEQFVPSWIRKQVANFDELHAWHGAPAGVDHFAPPFTILDIEVVAPSQVRFQGLICNESHGLLALGNQIYLPTSTGCSGASGYGTFILGGKHHAFCASPSRASYYKALGGGAIFELDY